MNKPQVDLTGARILIIDDVPANLEVLFRTLDEVGYIVLVANNGTKGLEVAAKSDPDLILLDVMMPGINGYETCRRLKANPELEDIPVIFLTARDDMEGIIEGFQAGGVDYIVKPFKKEEALVRMRTHLENARFARELAEFNALLEQKVQERTRQLQLKVRELEGKDRIAQHLLKFNSLEKTLELVLEIISDILELDRAAIYLKVEDRLVPAAAIGYAAAQKVVAHDQLEHLPVTSEHQQAFETVQQSSQSVNIREPAAPSVPPFAVVPVLRDAALIGLIEVNKLPDAQPVTDAELKILESFSLQAAVAINDAQVRQDTSTWEDQLDQVLERSEAVDDVDIFGELNDDSDG